MSSVPQAVKEGSCDVFQKFAAALVADLPSLTKSTMASPRPDGLESGSIIAVAGEEDRGQGEKRMPRMEDDTRSIEW